MFLYMFKGSINSKSMLLQLIGTRWKCLSAIILGNGDQVSSHHMAT